MPLPRPFFAPSFRYRRLDLFFAAIVGIMVYLATFAVAAEATLSAATYAWDRGMEGRLTVEIPSVGDEASTSQPERVRQALSILRAMPGIATATAMSDDDTAQLLKPWISQPELLKSLPIPSLIDVTRAPGSTVTAGDIAAQLHPTLRDAQVDDHASWLVNFAHLVHGLVAFGALTITLAALTLVIAVSLVCRAIMATERETISLLHILGAEDDDIARHFEMQARHLAGPASFAGFRLALISAGALLFFLQPFLALAYLHAPGWIGFAFAVLLVPVAAIVIAAFSARIATLNYLYTMP